MFEHIVHSAWERTGHPSQGVLHTQHNARGGFETWMRLCVGWRRKSTFMSGFFVQAEDGIRDGRVTGVQTCALPIFRRLEVELVGLEAPAVRVLERVAG